MTGAELGSVIAAAGLVPLLCAADLRLRAAGFVAWTAGVVVLAADLLHSPIARVRVQVTDRPALAAGGAIVTTRGGAGPFARRLHAANPARPATTSAATIPPATIERLLRARAGSGREDTGEEATVCCRDGLT